MASLIGPDTELLRFITCGSVDDGKSTLLGRLLYETNLIFEDQLAAVARDSARYGTLGDELDLALLLDGLEAEREQGITIDVAYRFFKTPKRKFIAADTPGHEQFTRNMVTAASTADLAIILVDARKGVLVQTRRHAYICSLLGVKSVLLAVNKMDAIDYDQKSFKAVEDQFSEFTREFGFETSIALPLSARYGDNVAELSVHTPWYDGPTLLAALEAARPSDYMNDQPFRFPIQWVNRPNDSFRGFAGTVASGCIRTGDRVLSPASGQSAHVTGIITFDGNLAEARAGQAVTLTLDAEIDLARGDVLCVPEHRPEFIDQIAAWIVWMSPDEMLPGRSYMMKMGAASVPARISTLKYRVDVNTQKHLAAKTLELNEIGYCNLVLSRAVAVDPYTENKRTGSFILIDRATNQTVGAGMVRFGLRRATNIHRQAHIIGTEARSRLLSQKPLVLWFTGMSGSGKSTIADLVEHKLHYLGYHTMLLDGDNIRHGLNSDLGFTDADRVENIRRVAEVAKLFIESGLIVLCSFISPFTEERRMVAELVGEEKFSEIFVDTPIDECIRRDPKGLYKKALAGEISNFTGVGSRYEKPITPAIRIDGVLSEPEASASLIVDYVLQKQR